MVIKLKLPRIKSNASITELRRRLADRFNHFYRRLETREKVKLSQVCKLTRTLDGDL